MSRIFVLLDLFVDFLQHAQFSLSLHFIYKAED